MNPGRGCFAKRCNILNACAVGLSPYGGVWYSHSSHYIMVGLRVRATTDYYHIIIRCRWYYRDGLGSRSSSLFNILHIPQDYVSSLHFDNDIAIYYYILELFGLIFSYKKLIFIIIIIFNVQETRTALFYTGIYVHKLRSVVFLGGGNRLVASDPRGQQYCCSHLRN